LLVALVDGRVGAELASVLEAGVRFSIAMLALSPLPLDMGYAILAGAVGKPPHPKSVAVERYIGFGYAGMA